MGGWNGPSPAVLAAARAHRPAWKYAVGHDGGRSYSIQDIATWTGFSTGSTDREATIWVPSLRLWVSVGAGGFIETLDTPNTNAVQRTSGTAAALYAICWDSTNSQLVVVGASVILTSPDAVNWTVQGGAPAVTFRSVTQGEGLIVAGGHDGALYTSPTGVTWTSRTSGLAAGDHIYGLAYSTFHGRFGAVWSDVSGGGGLWSEAGITWTACGRTSRYLGIGVSAGGRWVATLTQANQIHYTSDITSSWDIATNPVGTGAMNDARYSEDEGLWVAVGDTGVIVSSADDGATWTQRTSNVSDNLYGVGVGGFS